ncbi:hypothetical protein FHT32_003444 [Variovorax sp. SG517]|nr:hypothetical protein [Variovorax sp. SG517]
MNPLFSFPRWGRAGVGAGGVSGAAGFSIAACPHPNLPPEGEGAIPDTFITSENP